jgi:hypothetical protein
LGDRLLIEVYFDSLGRAVSADATPITPVEPVEAETVPARVRRWLGL